MIAPCEPPRRGEEWRNLQGRTGLGCERDCPPRHRCYPQSGSSSGWSKEGRVNGWAEERPTRPTRHDKKNRKRKRRRTMRSHRQPSRSRSSWRRCSAPAVAVVPPPPASAAAAAAASSPSPRAPIERRLLYGRGTTWLQDEPKSITKRKRNKDMFKFLKLMESKKNTILGAGGEQKREEGTKQERKGMELRSKI